MNDGKDVLLTVRWLVQDVQNAFHEEHGRMPTDEELKACLEALDVEGMESAMIERGWDFIYAAIDEATK